MYIERSTHFISAFKKRNSLSTRKAHLKRRPTASITDELVFKETFRNLLETVEHKYIINADECPWHTNEINKSTWARTGDDNIVIEGVEKECFTFIGSISANGDIIPPVFLAAGSTNTVDKNWFGEAHPICEWDHTKNWEYITDHTEKGWTNRESWARYLYFLREYISEGKNPLEEPKIYLICDSYSAHFPKEEEEETDPVQMAITANNIELIKVPEGLTDRYQPLDCLFFGALKSSAKHSAKQIVIQNMLSQFDGKIIKEDYRRAVITRPEMTKILVQCYYKLKETNTVKESWMTALLGKN